MFKNVTVTEPLSYLETIALEGRAIAVITDSGGVQREAYWSKKPVFVLRDTTEWVEQLATGWAYLVKEDELDNLSKIVKLRIL
jgi:UDP-N-acetylglucosamine 2-epimerase